MRERQARRCGVAIVAALLIVGCGPLVAEIDGTKIDSEDESPQQENEQPPESDEPQCLEFESCDNGVDDDCDGAADCADKDCADVAHCCVPAAEQCNGKDDDCDGVVDNGFVNLGLVCGSGVGACAVEGVWACVADGQGLACSAVPVAPGAENCGNGVDDDCDGTTDCYDTDCRNDDRCRVPCEETEGHNCNADDGHGDQCDAVYNNGCSAAKFWAWCNRRNTAQGCNDGSDDDCIWEVYLRTWVDHQCDSSTIELFDLDGSGYDEFVCTGSNGKTYTCTTPLVLAFDDAPVQYLTDTGRATFDLSTAQDGSAVRTDWPTAATPWLALDRDGDGRISSGRELFGSATRVGERSASNGFEALAALDSNRDRVIDRRDPAFERLLVWSDRDGDRESTAGELRSLASHGVVRIELGFGVDPRCDGRGNCEVERAALVWRDHGRAARGSVVDVHLRVQAAPLAIARAAR